LGPPEFKTVGRTEAEAIEQASQALAQWLAAARVVQVSIPVSGTGTGNPWLDGFGRSADDPDLDEYLDAIEQARATDERE
jgi:hypothetical protein